MAGTGKSIRRGTTLTEVCVALVIAAAAVGSLANLVTTTSAQRRAAEVRRLALQEVANQAERLALLPADDVTSERLSELKPSQDLLAAAPSARFIATVTAEPAPPAGKRIRLEVHWADSTGQPVEPVGLTVWKFDSPEAAP